MTPLIIEPTADTPKIHFDATKGYFEIANLSLPEGPRLFYLQPWMCLIMNIGCRIIAAFQNNFLVK